MNPLINSEMTKKLSLNNLITLVILTVITSIAVSYLMRQEIVTKDSHGNITAVGEIKPKLSFLK